ncbi:transposase [Streptomyces sp. NPDC020799]|uniref:transposase n=1 Tax=Streptomyces sp. NPDC020799 TaxID=3365091 RepID=UPI0037B21495
MTLPTARTWARRGHTPVIRVRGRTTRCLSVAALACFRPGERPRLICRPRRHISRKGARRSFAWTDYRDLLTAAHRQLGAPIVLVRDNPGTHLCAGMRDFAASQDWLTVFQLPAYSPGLNPVEGIWSLLRRGFTTNTAFTTPEELTRTVRHGLRTIQYRPGLIQGCLTETGLTIHHGEPTTTTHRQS